MSLVFTISAWLVNLTYFAHLQSLHTLTFAFFVKKYCKFNYICYLHIKSYIDKFYIDYSIVVIKVAKFSLRIFIFSQCLKRKFCVGYNTGNKIPRKRD